MMKCIVMTDMIDAIASGGAQPVLLRNDIARFRAITTGHHIIMGRKTYMQLPGSKPLPDRINCVLTNNPKTVAKMGNYDNLRIFTTIDDILKSIPDDAFVIGGGTIYHQFLQYCDTIYMTRVLMRFEHPSSFFPNFKLHGDWELIGNMDDDDTEIDRDVNTGIAYDTQLLIYRRVNAGGNVR